MEGRGPDKSFWSRRTYKRSAFPNIKRKLCTFVPVPVFLVPGLAEATLNRGALERGRGTRLTSCCSSQTFQFFDNWMLPTSREPDLMLEVGEKSSIWDTDLLRPLKSGALLGKYFLHLTWACQVVIVIVHIFMVGKGTVQHESKSALRPTYLTWGRGISLRRLIWDLCRLIKATEAHLKSYCR